VVYFWKVLFYTRVQRQALGQTKRTLKLWNSRVFIYTSMPPKKPFIIKYSIMFYILSEIQCLVSAYRRYSNRKINLLLSSYLSFNPRHPIKPINMYGNQVHQKGDQIPFNKKSLHKCYRPIRISEPVLIMQILVTNLI
jgi:hypothetical protein